MIKLLLVEDDNFAGQIILNGLQDFVGGYTVKLALNGREGLKFWKQFKPDIIVSDIDMPIMDGYKMVNTIRESDGDIPILYITGYTSSKYVVNGYKMGVNNYIKKPFTVEELDCHIQAVLKMKKNLKFFGENRLYKIGCYKFNLENATLYNNETNRIVCLSPRCFEVLKLLIENKNRIVKREFILKKIWGNCDFYSGRCLDVILSKLRKNYLKDDPSVQIKTVKKQGPMLLIFSSCALK